MRLGLVANTRSGAAEEARTVERLLSERAGAIEAVPLDAFCDGPESVDGDRVKAAARRLAEAGVERLVVAGGDGSLGPGGLLALEAGVPMAVIPVGTANSFARWLGLPLDLEEAVALATDPGAATCDAEVAEADGRPFVNVAATGLSVLAADNARPLKSKLGPLAYAVGAARAAATGRPLATTVRCDGEEAWRGEAWQVLVAASGAFGGDSSTGGVDPDDHRLDVAIVETGPRLGLVLRALAMRRGRLVHSDQVRHVRGAVVELEVGERSFNVDGEVLDLERARFSVVGQVAVVTG